MVNASCQRCHFNERTNLCRTKYAPHTYLHRKEDYDFDSDDEYKEKRAMYCYKNTRNNRKKNEFLHHLKSFLEENYNLMWTSDCNEVFSFLYDHFECEHLRTMCLAYMIFGTSGFKNLISTEIDDKYRARGFLQICSIENYIHLSEIMNIDYVRFPDKLAKFNVIAMKAALYMFDISIENVNVRTFADLVCALKPTDVNKAFMYDHNLHEIYENRVAVYTKLCKCFCLRKAVGERKFFE